MLFRNLALGFGLFCGVLASQLPEFAQQYRQRLGGALDELTALVEEFRGEAARYGLDPAGAIAKLDANPDGLARDRGRSMARVMVRRDRLAAQSEGFAAAGPFGRLVVFARDFDPQLASRTWSAFEPAVPVTAEGFASAGAGAAGGYALLRLIGAPFGRRRRTTPA